MVDGNGMHRTTCCRCIADNPIAPTDTVTASMKPKAMPSAHSPFSSSIRFALWLMPALCLVILMAGPALTRDHRGSPEGSGPPTAVVQANRPAVTPARAATVWLTAGNASPAAETYGRFSSPVESETPDIEPAMLKYKTIAILAVACPAWAPWAQTIVRRASVPLYLTHQSLLC